MLNDEREQWRRKQLADGAMDYIEYWSKRDLQEAAAPAEARQEEIDARQAVYRLHGCPQCPYCGANIDKLVEGEEQGAGYCPSCHEVISLS